MLEALERVNRSSIGPDGVDDANPLDLIFDTITQGLLISTLEADQACEELVRLQHPCFWTSA